MAAVQQQGWQHWAQTVQATPASKHGPGCDIALRDGWTQELTALLLVASLFSQAWEWFLLGSDTPQPQPQLWTLPSATEVLQPITGSPSLGVEEP